MLVTLCICFVFMVLFITTALLSTIRRRMRTRKYQEEFSLLGLTETFYLHETITAIVGAGVIGLCTTYHLAKTDQGRGTSHRVIDFEAAHKVFVATSSTDPGIPSDTGFEEDLLALAVYSYQQ